MKTRIIISIIAIAAFMSSCKKVDISQSPVTQKDQGTSLNNKNVNQPATSGALFIKASENKTDWNTLTH